MHRYIALIANSKNKESVRKFREFRAALASKQPDWTIAYDFKNAFVMHTGLRENSTEIYKLQNNAGAVLGTLFDRGHKDNDCRPAIALNEIATQKILRSRGRHLIEAFWGTYVAMIYDRETRKHYVFADPTGTLPCYRTKSEGVDIFFSNLEDCVRLLPIRFAVNRHNLACWLIFSGLTGPRCGFDGVEKVLGGQGIILSQDTLETYELWNPVAVASAPQHQDPNLAATELRSVVQNTISAWASCYESITLKLSGGLDSAIVAGCLAQSRASARVNYLNFSADVGDCIERLHLPGVDTKTADRLRAIAGTGDERYFARLVAERWKRPIVERQRSVGMDLSRMWEAPISVYPSMYFTAMDVDDVEIELAMVQKAHAFFSGQAGDSVLMATTQPLSAIDFVYLNGLTRNVWAHIFAASALSRDSIWNVFGKVIRHGLFHRPYESTMRFLGRPSLLNIDLIKTLTEQDFFSLRTGDARHLPPGKQLHASGLYGSLFYDYAFHSDRRAAHIDPLNAQPVWELMLQIPTYTVLAGGVSRGLARHAFSDLLPAEIHARQVKGTGTAFYQQVVRRNRNFLRERLLDGLLVRAGYLDRCKLDAYLAADEPFVTVDAAQILLYLSAEVWLEQVAGVQNAKIAA